MAEAASEQALQRWLQARAAQWRSLEELLTQARRELDPASAERLVRQYRDLARDLSLARRLLPGTALSRHLEALYREAHELIHRAPAAPLRRLAQLYREEIPAVTRSLRTPLLVVALIFLLCALAGAALVHRYPELASLFASDDMINGVQRGELWTDRLLNVVPSSLLSLGIMSNNIVVAISAFVLGSFYGLGTLYIVSLNGLMLGATLAFTARYGLAGELLRFIVAHGLVELSVIGIASAAGIRLGEALARPGQRPRAEAFRLAVADSSRLLAVCVPALVFCGLVEGFVSPDASYGLLTRVTIGVGGLVLLVAVMSGRAWRRRDA